MTGTESLKSTKKFEILDSFEDYLTKGGSVLDFPDYYMSTNHFDGLKLEKQVILLALCEDCVMAGDYQRVFNILNVIFSSERWTLNSFKRFLSCVKHSEYLRPFYQSIFNLHENCKNYIKSV